MRILALVLLAACGRKPPEGGGPADTDTDTDADTDADTDTDTDADTDTDTDTDPPATNDTADPDFAVVINEVFADAAVSDANCDGTASSTDDEFLEIANPGLVPLDLSGGTITDLTGVRHTFPAGTLLEPGGGVVVFGAGTPTFDGTNPAPACAPLPAGVLVQVSSTGAVGLNNDGDTITLLGPAGTQLAQVIYGVEADAAESLNLDPELDPAGRWVLHSTIPGATGDWSPGRRADGGAFGDAPVGGGTDTGTPPFVPPSVLVNEINADPSTVDGDANCDGVIDSGDDEFVELYNPTASPVDLTGWTLVDDTAAVRHTFPATTLDPGAVLVVFGGGTPTFDGSQPHAWCGALGVNVQTQVASSGLLGLSFPTDVLTMYDAVGAIMDTWAFGMEANADQSLVRDPEITGTTFVQHGSSLGANRPISPGTRRDGTAL